MTKERFIIRSIDNGLLDLTVLIKTIWSLEKRIKKLEKIHKPKFWEKK